MAAKYLMVGKTTIKLYVLTKKGHVTSSSLLTSAVMPHTHQHCHPRQPTCVEFEPKVGSFLAIELVQLVSAI